MYLSMLWIFMVFCTRGLPASLFVRVLGVSLEKYANNVIATYNNTNSHGYCAKECKSDCESFSFDSETRQCRTFDKEFCTDSTASNSPAMMFTKVDKEIKNSNGPYPANCNELDPAIHSSGVYRINLLPGVCFKVYCDMDTADGPWTVIQNRADGEVKFNRTWEEYKNGFGDLNGNFWLGNEAIHHFTLKPSSLRIELVSGSNDDGHAQYSAFRVGSEMDNYRLSVSGFSGNISDAMAKHDGMQFSTFDRDNDQWKWSCARASSGGWWYKNCVHANLNGGKYNNKLWNFFYNTTQRCRMKKTKMLMKTIF